MLKKFFTRSRALCSIGVLAVLLTVGVAAAVLVMGHSRGEGGWGSLWGAAEEMTVSELPAEAQETLRLIKQGGPFPYKEDGTRFRNRDKKLPMKRRGYYRIYVVPTPGASGLGKRRIVAGAGKNGYRTSGEYWYTDNDYEVLHRIRE